MKRIVAGATGFVGEQLVKSWLEDGIDTVVISRSVQTVRKVFGDKVEAVTWDDLLHAENLESSDIEVVVNLTGAGIADKRWTKERKMDILNSRVDATNIISRFCMDKRLPLLNASAVGFYGPQETVPEGLPDALDERFVPPKDKTPTFLAQVCYDWEAASKAAEESGLRVCHLRIGVVLGNGGGALQKMALPFKLFAGGPIGSGKQPIPWIHLDDVVGAINFLIKNQDIHGAVNLTAPGCVTNKDLGKALGKALKRPSFMPTPGFMLELILGEMAGELLLEGQNVKPAVLLDNQYSFKFPDIDSALANIYN